VIPSEEEERSCYEAFFRETGNEEVQLKICPICGREKLTRFGRQTSLLSDESVIEVLEEAGLGNGSENSEMRIIRELLEIEEGEVRCWMCLECLKALENHAIPKLSLANNLWIRDVPCQLSILTIPEQLLVARHYPRCYIFKQFLHSQSNFPVKTNLPLEFSFFVSHASDLTVCTSCLRT
jgi:uncharacterized protein DUF6570